MGSTRPGPYGLYQPSLTDLVKPASNDYPSMLASIEGKIALVRSDVQGDVSAANTTAGQALTKANAANTLATSANTTAGQANTAAANAVSTANAAKATANGIAATAQAAEDKADQAIDTANDAKDIQLANAAAPDAQVGGYVTTPGTDTNLGVLEVIGDEFPTQSQARLAAYQVLATDHGVQAGTSTDQTANLQAALNAAAANGADLMLPTGAIKLSGVITWKSHIHSVVGTQGTVLDWSAATVTGPVFNVDGSRLPGSPTVDAIVMSSKLSKVTINGPTAAGTTTDGLSVTGRATSGTSVYGVKFEQVVLTGFRRQEVFGNYAWLIQHDQCYFSKAVDAAVDYQGKTTTGENISYTDCSFANGNIGFRAMVNGTGLDVAFRSCSFDYNTGPSLQACTGSFLIEGCHLENGAIPGEGTVTTIPNYVELTSNTSSTHTPVVAFSGGIVLTEGSTWSGPFPGQLVVVQTSTTGSNMPPIVVTATGLTIKNLASGAPPLTFHHETTATNKAYPSYPKVTLTGVHLNYRGSGISYSRPGEATNVLTDSGFEASLASGAPAWNAASGFGQWSTPQAANVTLDVNQHVSGTKSAKLAYATAAPGSQAFMQNFAAVPLARYHVSCWIRTDSWVKGSRDWLAVIFYNMGGAQIANISFAMGTGIVGTKDWTFVAGWVVAPGAAVVGEIHPLVTGSTGTMWIDDLQVSPC